MLWILISLSCCYLIYRAFRMTKVAPTGYDEPTSKQVYKPYVAILAVLTLAAAWPPFNQWRMQRFLSAKATILADQHPAKVHCNTIFDTYFDVNSLASGHANPKTGEIVIQYPWCNTLMSYLAHPARANWQEVASLNLFTHESMHVRGEYDEAKTECQAVQRNYRAARLLGVPDAVAKKNALDYYFGSYMQRANQGEFSAQYFSSQRAPGKALDEHLGDSSWSAQ
jgi:hypothetical protein